MNSITFECKTITPMLMHGADGKSAELRPASIKGVLRFWWRAIHGNLSLKDLHEQEGEIFGSTEERSKVIIFPIEITKTEDFQISPTPHHRQGYCSKDDESKNCFSFNEKTKICKKATLKTAKLYTFTLKMMIHPNDYTNKEQLKNLFILATTLGGFGQRSRRGFGSVKITAINGSEASASPKEDENKPLFPKTFKDIEELINQTPKFQNLNKHKDDEYPYIQEIKVGKTYNTFNELLRTIGEASHTHDCNELGSISPRLASPIYVSVIQDGSHFRPVITTLKNTKSDNNNEKVTLFKGAING